MTDPSQPLAAARVPSAAERLSERAAAAAPAAVVAYFAVQTALRTTAPGGLGLDEAEQMVATQALAWGYGDQPPLYTWIQIAVFEALGEGKLGLSALKNALLAATALGLWTLARGLGADRRVAAAAMLGIFLLPSTGWEAQRALTHSVLATALAVWTAVAALHVRGSGRYAALGVLVGLGLLAKGSFAPFALGLVAALLMAGASWAGVALLAAAAAAVAAGPALWALDNEALVLASVHKFGMTQPGADAALSALASFAEALAAGLGIAAALWLVLRFLGRGKAAPAVDARFVERLVLAALGAALLIALVAGATEVKERWFQPVLVFVPLILACRAVPRAGAAGFLAVGVAASALALAAAAALFVNLRQGGGNPAYQSAPFARTAEILDAGAILADDEYLGGNLRLLRPDLAVRTPRMAGMDVARTPSAAVWWSRDRPRPMPEGLVALIARESDAAPGPARAVEAPYPAPHAERSFHLFVAPLDPAAFAEGAR